MPLGRVIVLQQVAGESSWTTVVRWEGPPISKIIRANRRFIIMPLSLFTVDTVHGGIAMLLLHLNGSEDPLRNILHSLRTPLKHHLPSLLLLKQQSTGLSHLLPFTLLFHLPNKFVEPGFKFSFHRLRLVPRLQQLMLSIIPFVLGSTSPRNAQFAMFACKCLCLLVVKLQCKIE